MPECSWIDGTAASRYDWNDTNRRIVRERYSHIASHLVGDTVLDMGCAYGIGTNQLAEEGYAATGMDIEQRIVSFARDEFAQDERSAPSYVIGDLRSVSVDDAWDNYVISDVIQHVPDSPALLEQWNESLETLLIGTTLIKGHENLPDEKMDENPGLVTPAEIEEIFPDAETWQRPQKDIDHRFWFKIDRTDD